MFSATSSKTIRTAPAVAKVSGFLYRLALDKADEGDRFHAVAEEGMPVRDIAESIGRGLDVP